MKEKESFHRKVYRRLVLLLPGIVLLGLTACSTAGGTARHNYKGGYADIRPLAYNPESRGFDRPWPYGPESTQQ